MNLIKNDFLDSLASFGFESDHCHDSYDDKAQNEKKKRRKAMKKLLIATALSFCFMVGEIIGKLKIKTTIMHTQTHDNHTVGTGTHAIIHTQKNASK